ncbi:carboxypeptidase-like regulatory domain-containing protein [Mucilaginibacter myungsuensis]|uniref:Carboxypeptidase-like regulatory domain-containing protein n=1 Tax=Mucilaginibacter myungsuensis TaxID=649104 RepID=A0A929PW87_9SPHI|nr:carboxypeptidase-like regulatory domain-containing protein [Mucilaginibacter myungsuensis]MBE9661821.1 carboxypeptidase-like regulatory domain-containing protein [Mucilaginibacter myungsuensis]MDN3599745.1 carboxypeptidase-like regulatory domain-containing protein [Mucilaginibacter myungsuensis]
MRHLIYCFLLIIGPGIASAQKIFEGQVVDKETEATVPGVTVKLLKEGKGTQTNNRGYYKLISADTIANDSLHFTSIGYKTLRVPVTAYQQGMFIELEASTTELKGVTITKKAPRKPVLNKFSLANIKEYRFKSAYGKYANRTWPFRARIMVAMKMKAKHKNVRISSINIGRREFDENYYPDGQLALPVPHTRFLVHIMSRDELTGLPDQKIYTKDIRLSDNSQMVIIDVSQDNWTVAGDTFFVAVEWLRIPINQVLQLDADLTVSKTTRSGEQKLGEAPTYHILYQPAITIMDTKVKYEGYKMNEPGIWQYITSPLAISATIMD